MGGGPCRHEAPRPLGHPRRRLPRAGGGGAAAERSTRRQLRRSNQAGDSCRCPSAGPCNRQGGRLARSVFCRPRHMHDMRGSSPLLACTILAGQGTMARHISMQKPGVQVPRSWPSPPATACREPLCVCSIGPCSLLIVIRGLQFRGQFNQPASARAQLSLGPLRLSISLESHSAPLPVQFQCLSEQAAERVISNNGQAGGRLPTHHTGALSTQFLRGQPAHQCAAGPA